MRIVSTLLLGVVFAVSHGNSKPPMFREEPGQMEFTGRMIARPMQMADLLQRGMSANAARQRRAAARAAVLPNALEYVPETDEYILKVPARSDENRMARELLATGNFQYVEPDWRVYPVLIPNDPLYPQQWHLPKIQAPLAWDHFTGNSAVTVALCDTGVRLDHEDLAALLVPGYNAVDQIAQSDGGQVNDINGHGTHVAGTAAAAGNNGRGVSGVGWNLRIMPIRVSNQTSGSSSITVLTRGARWAADNGARVVSTSYSGVSSSSVQTTGAYIKARNGVYLWAAGNSNTNLSGFDHVDVTIVGASDQNDAKASFSSYGRAIDVFAPGVSIVATYYSSPTSYASMSGTSMATPCAAGVAAVIMASNPSLSAQQVETLLYQSCDDIGAPGEDDVFGWGRVNVYNGVRASYATYPFLPTSFQVRFATHDSGGLPQLFASDDSYVAATAFTSTGMENVPPMLEVETSSTNGLIGQFDVVVETSLSIGGVLQRVELFDWSANTYVTVDLRPATTFDQTITVTPSNPNRFRQAFTGIVRSRIVFELQNALFVPRTWQIRFDRVTFRTAP